MKIFKMIVKVVTCFMIGLGVGKLISKLVCKKYASYEMLSDSTEIATR